MFFECYLICFSGYDLVIELFNHPGQEVRVGSSRKTLEINGNMEAVFRSESLWSFSVDFRLASHSFRQEMPVNHRKKSENFPVGILLPFLIIFRAFSTGSSDFSASFQPVPVKFQLFPVAGIIVLGQYNRRPKVFDRRINTSIFKEKLMASALTKRPTVPPLVGENLCKNRFIF